MRQIWQRAYRAARIARAQADCAPCFCPNCNGAVAPSVLFDTAYQAAKYIWYLSGFGRFDCRELAAHTARAAMR